MSRFSIRARPHTRRLQIIFGFLTVLAIVWRVFEVWSNIEFIGQKSGLLWDITRFVVATQTGANILLVVFFALFVLSLLFKIDRAPATEEATEGLTSPQAAALHEKQANAITAGDARLVDYVQQIKNLTTERDKANEAAIGFQNDANRLRKSMEEHGCPDVWLHKLAKWDAEHLGIMVRVNKIVCRNEMRTGVLSYYYFHFVIENLTVYPIHIDRNISGSIGLNGYHFKHAPEMTQDSPLRCAARTEIGFAIRLQLEYPQEVEFIEKTEDNQDFLFTSLKIMLSGAEPFEKIVEETQLNTRYGVTKGRGWGEGNSLHNYA